MKSPETVYIEGVRFTLYTFPSGGTCLIKYMKEWDEPSVFDKERKISSILESLKHAKRNR